MTKFICKWIKLKNMILSEVTQTQEDKRHMFSLICGFEIQIFNCECIT